MQITKLPIEGLLLIDIDSFADNRGFFVERFHHERFSKNGLPTQFDQDNFSRSLPGVLRGLHYQDNPVQGKLITTTRGQIWDIAVDLRHNSSTYGQYHSVEMSGNKPQWFWIPPGFAHGFCVLGNEPADVLYKVNGFYNPKGENGLIWNDKDLNIKWPLSQPNISPKDSVLMTFQEYKKNPIF